MPVMIKRPFFCIVALVSMISISGCDSGGAGIPEIVGNVGYAAIKPLGAFLPREEVRTIKPVIQLSRTVPWDWHPPASRERSWKAIIIHHSATHNGNARVFHDIHKNVKKWDGIGYDFVVGNGNGSGNGQVEVTYRWRQQIAGAHCGGTPRNWANEEAIGICMVGDFTKTAPTAGQLRSLAKLVSFLQSKYRIPSSRIYGHGSTPGYTGGTMCPGDRFSMAAFKRML